MTDLMEAVTSLAKRRGIAFQSAEIYGGLRSSWDYGPLGVELRRNIRNAWWRAIVQLRDDVVGRRGRHHHEPTVWQASGHLETFHDPLVECTNCHQRFREDHLQQANADGVVLCPNCGGAEFTEPKQFNLMLKTFLGPDRGRRRDRLPATRDRAGHVRELPGDPGRGAQEAAVRHRADRQVVPQRDHAGQLHLPHARVRADGDGVLRRARHRRRVVRRTGSSSACNWYLDLGVSKDKLRLRPHETEELAHYAKAATDIEYEFPFGWQELEGIANRTDYDLGAHQAASGEDLTYFDQEKEAALPPVRGRAGGRGRPRHADVPARRLPRRGGADRQGRHRQADGPGAAPRPRADQGRRAAALAQREARARGAARARPGQARVDHASTTTPARSGAATAAKTRWERRSASRSTSTRSTTGR